MAWSSLAPTSTMADRIESVIATKAHVLTAWEMAYLLRLRIHYRSAGFQSVRERLTAVRILRRVRNLP